MFWIPPINSQIQFKRLLDTVVPTAQAHNQLDTFLYSVTINLCSSGYILRHPLLLDMDMKRFPIGESFLGVGDEDRTQSRLYDLAAQDGYLVRPSEYQSERTRRAGIGEHTSIGPTLELGLWIDNQCAAWTPEGHISYGTLEKRLPGCRSSN